MISISKTFTINASHRLYNNQATEEWNKEVFGKCANAPSHGHAWKLIVEVTGNVNRSTGMIINFVELKDLVNEMIVDRLDHHFINDVLDGIIPTCENLIIWMRDQIVLSLPAELSLRSLTLYETEGSYAYWKEGF